MGTSSENAAIIALRILSWLFLLAGVGVAVVTVCTISVTQPVGIDSALGALRALTSLGVALLAVLGGILLWAVLLVLATIAESLLDIRYNRFPGAFHSAQTVKEETLQ